MTACRSLRRLAAFATAALLAAAAAAQPASAPAPAKRPAAGAGSLSGSSPDADCAVQRKRYLDSQACFERYRSSNGSVKPEGYKACRNVVDPAPRCGPDLPTR